MIGKKLRNSTTFRSLLIVLVFIFLITGIALKGYLVGQKMLAYGRSMGVAGYQRTATYVMLLDAYNIRQDYLEGDYEKYHDGVEKFYSLDSMSSSYINSVYKIRDGSAELKIPKEDDEQIIAKINDIAKDMDSYLAVLEDVVYEPEREYNFTQIYIEAETIVFEINSLVGLYDNRYQDIIEYENNLFKSSFVITIIFAVTLFWINTHIFKYETLAKYDVLTGLRNIGYLREEAMSLEDKKYAVAFIDLNKFKTINDTYGHAVGDDILRAVGKRTTKVFKHEYAFRYGGDEIVIFISEKNCGKTKINEYIKDMNDIIFQPVKDSNGMIHVVTAAVGIIGPDVTKVSISKALNLADSLMYKAKQNQSDEVYYVNDDKELFEIIGENID